MAGTAAALSEQQKIELVLAQLESLPALSPIVARILEITSDSHSNTRELVSLIEGDPSLTARVLSMLNRADKGVLSGSATVTTAVTLLGYKTIRHIALGVKVMEIFGRAEPTAEGEAVAFNRLEFWKHCLGVACAARGLAAVVGGWDPEEAFVCGLLHDIGKAAIDATLPKSAARIARNANETRGDIADAERSLLGIDHAMIGRRLAQRWGLPQRVVDCIWLHHQDVEALPPSVAVGKHVQVVQLADTLVRERRIGWSGNHRVRTGAGTLAARLGIAPEALERVISTLVDEIERRAEWIGLDGLDGREMYVKALSDASAELSNLNASLADQNRRLERTARYFEAIGWLSQNLNPRATVREVCGAAAEAVRRALDALAALCVVAGTRARWLDAGLSVGGQVSMDMLDPAATAGFDPKEADFAARVALTGTWLAPPGRSFDAIVDRYRADLGDEAVWLLPVVLERRWVGGVLVAADPDRVAAWHAESRQLEALVAALGLTIAHARAQAEALALGEELAEANRRSAAAQAEAFGARTFETIVAIAAGAAHEMNNPLAVISGRAQMLKGRAADEADRKALEAIVEQVRACSAIATDLMDFAQPGAAMPEDLDLRPVVESVRDELADEGALSAADVTLEIASDTPKVRFDRGRLRGIFVELLRNSADATDSMTRRISIKACVDRTDKGVVVLIADNGGGMTPDVLERAFDPFFSRRPAGRRRGLGLSRVQHWIRQAGGGVRLESSPGAGTLVELRLPFAEDATD